MSFLSREVTETTPEVKGPEWSTRHSNRKLRSLTRSYNDITRSGAGLNSITGPKISPPPPANYLVRFSLYQPTVVMKILPRGSERHRTHRPVPTPVLTRSDHCDLSQWCGEENVLKVCGRKEGVGACGASQGITTHASLHSRTKDI